jgi:hypothetical protein
MSSLVISKYFKSVLIIGLIVSCRYSEQKGYTKKDKTLGGYSFFKHTASDSCSCKDADFISFFTLKKDYETIRLTTFPDRKLITKGFNEHVRYFIPKTIDSMEILLKRDNEVLRLMEYKNDLSQCYVTLSYWDSVFYVYHHNCSIPIE